MHVRDYMTASVVTANLRHFRDVDGLEVRGFHPGVRAR